MLTEIRMTDSEGNLIPTQEDKKVPALAKGVMPGAIFLSDYCFNSEGSWIKPQQMLSPEEVAVVVYDPEGKITSMVIGNEKIDPEEAYDYLPYFTRNVMTRYQGQEGKEIFMFHFSPDTKRRVSCQI